MYLLGLSSWHYVADFKVASFMRSCHSVSEFLQMGLCPPESFPQAEPEQYVHFSAVLRCLTLASRFVHLLSRKASLTTLYIQKNGK